MLPRRKTVLLTGGAGVLGRAFIDELSTDHDIVCLRHRTPVSDPRVVERTGSLSHPTLGLSPREYAGLASQVDVVLHAAANTSWKATPEQIRETNVGGTRSMLAFARRADAPLFYVSTAYVANPPSTASARDGGARAYIDSKIEAEELAHDSGVPSVVLRPSVVIGDSRDGRMAAFQGLHRVAGMIARGQVPMVACEEQVLIDTVPQDVVATATGALIRQDARDGDYWLTAGASAMTAGDLVRASIAVGQQAGLTPHSPRFIAAEAVDRLIVPMLDDVISPRLRRMFSELLEMTWLFQAPAALPSSLPALGLAEQVTRSRLCEVFERSMQFWARQKGLLPDVATPTDEAYDVETELAS
jgi:thioester reductase-like protein